MIENHIKTVLLLGGLTGILLWVGQYLGGPGGLIIALVFAGFFNILTYWFSDKFVLRMYKAQPMSESEDKHIFQIIRQITQEANMPMPKLYRIRSATPNAFATGRNPKHAAIAITTGIEQLLSDDELKGVLAHEMSHIKNRDTLIATIAACLAGVISYIAMVARWSAIFGGFDDDNSVVEFIVLAFVTPLMAMLIQLAISRSREYLADATGAKLIHNPLVLAQALRKLEHGNKVHPMRHGTEATASLFIVNPFTANAMMRLLSTHPPMQRRIEKLEAM